MNSGGTLVPKTRCVEDIGRLLARTVEAKTAFVYFVASCRTCRAVLDALRDRDGDMQTPARWRLDAGSGNRGICELGRMCPRARRRTQAFRRPKANRAASSYTGPVAVLLSTGVAVTASPRRLRCGRPRVRTGRIGDGRGDGLKRWRRPAVGSGLTSWARPLAGEPGVRNTPCQRTDNLRGRDNRRSKPTPRPGAWH